MIVDLFCPVFLSTGIMCKKGFEFRGELKNRSLMAGIKSGVSRYGSTYKKGFKDRIPERKRVENPFLHIIPVEREGIGLLEIYEIKA